MPFRFTPFPDLPEVVVVECDAYADERGSLAETFKRSAFAEAGLPTGFVQENHARSIHRHVLRGLHFQTRAAAQGKLVRCVRGEVLDVAVDVRKGSPTYARWVSTVLGEDGLRMMWVPPGFAHGLCSLTERSDVAYKTTAEYSPAHDRSVRWDDPAIGVRWPTGKPVLSKKDAEAPLLADADNDHVWEGPR